MSPESHGTYHEYWKTMRLSNAIVADRPGNVQAIGNFLFIHNFWPSSLNLTYISSSIQNCNCLTISKLKIPIYIYIYTFLLISKGINIWELIKFYLIWKIKIKNKKWNPYATKKEYHICFVSGGRRGCGPCNWSTRKRQLSSPTRKPSTKSLACDFVTLDYLFCYLASFLFP